MSINSIAILGAGAVGAAIAHQLMTARPAFPPVILARGERQIRYEQRGFTVNGDPIKPAVAESGEFDLIILAVKSYHLERALSQLDESMGTGTLVMSLLNGIESEDRLGRRYGHGQVVPAMILGIDAQREESGIRYLNRGRIFFGANPKADMATAEAAASAVRDWFVRTGLAFELCRDITSTLWHKFMINVGINQASALLKAPYGTFQTDGDPRDLMMGSLREVVALSELEGTGLSEDNISRWLEVLDTLDPTGMTSMAQDAAAGRRMEVDLFADTVVAMACRHGLEVPVNRRLRRELSAMQPREGGS